MGVAKQVLDDELEAAETDADSSGERDRLESGAYGELMLRAAERPLCFNFVWRGSSFHSVIERLGDGMRLSLSSDLAEIPYSVENAITRGGLLVFGETLVGKQEMKLKIVQGQKITIEHEIALPESQSDTMVTLVTQLTMLVLNSAPYLDLIAEYASQSAED